MIDKFVKLWEDKKGLIRERFKNKHPDSYNEIIEIILKCFYDENSDENLNPEAIHEIDDGNYQGTLIYVIPLVSYWPDIDDYYYTSVSYGSCSGCDTLQGIKDGNYQDIESSDIPSETQINDYMTLCLHIVQNLRKLNA